MMHNVEQNRPENPQWFMIRRYERGAEPVTVLNFLKNAAAAWLMARQMDMDRP